MDHELDSASSGQWGGGSGDDPGALLRPRVRVRDYAGLPPPAQSPDLGGGRPVTARAARSVVVVELHHVGHERARPRDYSRAPANDRLDAREPVDGGSDPASLR